MMYTWFGKPKMWLANKYDGQDNPRAHLAKWTKVYGEKPQAEWVHLFCHTLDVFMLTFSFEDGIDNIDEALQEVKEAIFRIP